MATQKKSYFCPQKKMFQLLAKINKFILPSFSKKRLDLSKANKLQLAIIGWRAFVTKRALDEMKKN